MMYDLMNSREVEGLYKCSFQINLVKNKNVKNLPYTISLDSVHDLILKGKDSLKNLS